MKKIKFRVYNIFYGSVPWGMKIVENILDARPDA